MFYQSLCIVRKSCFYLLFLLIAHSSLAQYTRQDTLRGSLSPLRSCYDVHYYDLSLEVLPEKRFISGKNVIHYVVKADFKRLQLDLFANMAISKIVWEGKNLDFKREGNAVFVNFPQIQTKGTLNAIEIWYEGQPRAAKNPPWDGGFSWRKSGGKDWIGVSCGGIGASLWWPNKDHLSEEPDSMRIRCAVPEGLWCVSNGLFQGKRVKENGLVEFDWKVQYPINNYNVTLNIADYAHFSDVYTASDGEKLTLDYYVLPQNLEKAKKQFEQAKPMLACYEKLFGKYPFWKDGFKLVETPYLGMEHQSAIAYGNGYRNGYMGTDLSRSGVGLEFDYIIIHESGHEYWGNNLSCHDHAEMWMHESWCTYTEVLYVECMFGKAKADDYVKGYRASVMNNKPMLAPLGVNAEAPSDIYFKGALMLHTLRNVVNDDKLWFKMIYDLQQHFRHQTLSSRQMLDFMNEVLQHDYTYFFRQYLQRAAIPTLEIEQKNGQVKYRWVNAVKEFRMPIKVLLNGQEQIIKPTISWQRLENAKSLEVLQELYYIEVKEL